MTYKIVSRQFDLEVDGSTLNGYLARPQGTGTFPAVLVGAELWGLTEDARRIVDRVAALGYVAFVVNVYHRSGPETAAGLAETDENRMRAFGLLDELTRDGVEADFRSAIAYAREHGGATDKTGVLGFSLGGHLAYFAATRLELDAAAVFYPGWLTTAGTALSRPEPLLAATEDIAKGDVRLVLFFAELDHVIDAAQREQLETALNQADVRHESVVYPGARHAFFFPGREPYDEAAATDSWQRTSELFAAELG
ncbi:dienelactone hydrolase family protein [Nocardia sp. NPDC052112]|uniref:dienelactone hydrolase family protein n=1 Tax=Nocardia sp. NPDC052112 TaxID=3155646 RepID=UPI003423256E